jgi:hypothetical protein
LPPQQLRPAVCSPRIASKYGWRGEAPGKPYSGFQDASVALDAGNARPTPPSNEKAAEAAAIVEFKLSECADIKEPPINSMLR